MHGLVPQPAIPSPHAEYLGITPSEVSNADRSSALGLRLNQQHENEKQQQQQNNNKILCDTRCVIGAIGTVGPERSAANGETGLVLRKHC